MSTLDDSPTDQRGRDESLFDAAAAVPTPDPSFTRAEVAAMVGVSVSGLRHWEREGLLSPSVRKAVGWQDTRPNLYSALDAAKARLISGARALGVRRSALQHPLEVLDALNLEPGWRGWLLIGGGGRTRPVSSPTPDDPRGSAEVTAALARAGPSSTLVVWLEVPTTPPTEEAG